MTPRPTHVRIAAAQYPLDRYASLSDYKSKLARWIVDAAGNGAELLVFPEYGAMEYAAASGPTASDLTRSLAAVSDAIAEMDVVHAAVARAHGVHLLAASGPCRLPDGRYVNRARLFTPSGHSGFQDKLIMTPFECDWGITPGAELAVFETTLGCIGIAICYDSEFPLLVRALCEAGAEIILIPSCTEFVSGFHRVRTAAMARALENGCVTVQSSTVGDAAWSPAIDKNTGAAGIFMPAENGLSETGVLAQGPLNHPQWVFATVDLGALRRVRAAGEMRNTLDWRLQPGAQPLEKHVRRISLT